MKAVAPEETFAWHSLDPDAVLTRLESCQSGLSDETARVRLLDQGPNRLPATRRRSALRRFCAQLNNSLIYFLLAAAIGAAALGDLLDAAVVLLVVLLNALVGFIQEGRAERAVEAIRDLVSPRASVVRESLRRSIEASQIVPGDIIIVEAGDKVPADARLLHASGLLADEATLTGESLAVQKEVASVGASAPLGERTSMIFAGTLMAAGQARAVVVATGAHTQLGKISQLVRAVPKLRTPLLRQIDVFTRKLTLIMLASAVLLFIFAVFVRDFSWTGALIAVVALTVGAIPEGLPAVITIALAIGVRRMAARQTAIRHLPAVETLGAISVICTDKTGTLTRNEMIARRIVTDEHQLTATGSGLNPDGYLAAGNRDDDAAAIAAAMPIIRAGLLCNNATIECRDGTWAAHGDPLEAALVSLAMKAGMNAEHIRGEWPRLDEIPFEAARRFMATLHVSPAGEKFAFVKGAPEQILAMSAARADLWDKRTDAAAREGERVIALAMKPLSTGCDTLDVEDVSRNLIFLGLIGFIDPPRPEAVAAVAACRSAGIAVKMITGDHLATATAIARQLAIAEDPQVLTGADLDRLDDRQLAGAIGSYSVFARTDPGHKLRIVRALQANGEIVAMTGDGVNDAPALKQADIGTAMGIKGTDAAREASDMVLLDDNFASIVAAIGEGRIVYDNIRKVIALTLPTDGGEILVVVLAILSGFILPITATQILWLNLVTAVTLGLVLAFEPAEPGIMTRPPRRRDAPLLSPFLVWRVFLMSGIFTLLSLAIFEVALHEGRSIETARTMVVNMIAGAEVAYLFNIRFLHGRSLTVSGILGTPHVWAALAAMAAAQSAFTFLPAANRIFQSAPLGLSECLIIAAIVFALFVLLEGEKAVLRRLDIFDELRR
jgi:magnesium-transporting ATPase (P-type)